MRLDRGVAAIQLSIRCWVVYSRRSDGVHYQIFMPGKTVDVGGCLNEVGLGDFAQGASGTVLNVNGQRGMVATWGMNPAPADSLKWIDFEGLPFLVGFNLSDMPTEIELKKPEQFAGWQVPMANGVKWSIPAAGMLPQNLRMVSGKWERVRQARFDEYWSRSEVWFKRWMDQGLVPSQVAAAENLTEAEFIDQAAGFACFALRQNYRVIPEVVSELGLLSDRVMADVILAAIDSMKIIETKKVIDEHIDAVAVGLKKNQTESNSPQH